jgi:signal transduction histidine kinase
MYDGAGPDAKLLAVAGFLVSMNWVRHHYFQDFVQQLQGIIGDTSLSIEILDGQNQQVAAVGPPAVGVTAHERRFPLLFADPALLAVAQRRQASEWTTRFGVASEASRLAASRSASRTLVLLGLGAMATMIGLGITVGAARRAADLAAVQSEFVSAVSHEMKTPLSLIKLASDTLANGRYADPSAIADYGRLMGTEAQHLTRLIDNVLCYARITDTMSEYDFDTIDVAELVQESVDRFRPQTSGLGLDVQVRLPHDPVFIRADHLMMVHVFDNLVDNAAKYAASGRFLSVRATPRDRDVIVEIADKGEGMAADDVPRVFEKFYRRKGTQKRGAGLGLAIVRRVVEDHGGRVEIDSSPGHGTRVSVILPTVAA